MKNRLIEILRERSPRTTAEIAEKLGVSWHTIHEKLLEMQIEGIVKRIVVSGRHLWFLENDKLLEKFSNSSEFSTPEVKLRRLEDEER
jgi:DNA-binding Lrp family transcriptional regulator